MRISDWSSDVCSSDLARLEIARALYEHGDRATARPIAALKPDEHLARIAAAEQVEERPRHRLQSLMDGLARIELARLEQPRHVAIELVHARKEIDHDETLHPDPRADRPRAIDRQSVVQGKSVSVRVDIGGRRSIKKKK